MIIARFLPLGNSSPLINRQVSGRCARLSALTRWRLRSRLWMLERMIGSQPEREANHIGIKRTFDGPLGSVTSRPFPGHPLGSSSGRPVHPPARHLARSIAPKIATLRTVGVRNILAAIRGKAFTARPQWRRHTHNGLTPAVHPRRHSLTPTLRT